MLARLVEARCPQNTTLDKERLPCRSTNRATSASATRRLAPASRCWSPLVGANSRVSNWPTAVINAMEEFTHEFRCITMDQRNANGGESSGPVPVDDPWGAFADDQLGLMDHLGIREFFFMGYCIGSPFALKLMERAPERVVAGVLCQPVGHRRSSRTTCTTGAAIPGPALLARRPDLTMETIEAYLHNLFRVQPDFVYSVATSCVLARHQCW